MSQPQLTKFFGTTKRGTRATGKASQKNEALVTRRSCRGSKDELAGAKLGVEDVKKVLAERACEPPAKKENEEGKTVDKENASKDQNVCPSPVKRPRRSSRSEAANEEVAKPVRKTKNKAA